MAVSFASDVKAELCGVETGRDCCRFALLYGMVLAGAIVRDGALVFDTENKEVSGLIVGLFRQVFQICPQKAQLGGRSPIYRLTVLPDATATVLDAFLMRGPGSSLPVFRVKDVLLRKECCLRAFLRGVFLSAGFLSDPQKTYHFEIVVRHRALCADLQRLFERFGVRLKQTERKSMPVLYLKESEGIADVLSVVGAYQSLMEFRNTQVLKDVRNHVNRVVNCETANVTKTANAAVQQIQAIECIERERGLSSLPDDLRELCELRLAAPDATLSELGQQLSSPISKSGVNHRFQKLLKMAQDLETAKPPH